MYNSCVGGFTEPKHVWAGAGPAPGWSGPPPAYSEAVPGAGGVAGGGAGTVVHVVHPVIFGDQPVQTMCPQCGSQVKSTLQPTTLSAFTTRKLAKNCNGFSNGYWQTFISVYLSVSPIISGIYQEFFFYIYFRCKILYFRLTIFSYL